MLLVEKYRPKTLDEVVGQDKTVARLRSLFERGIGGRAFWLSGPTGSGKTTLARIIADQIASDWTTEELDSSGLTPAVVVDWERKISGRGLNGTGWALIVNEAHGLRKDTIRQFLVTLERLPSHSVAIFTTTSEGQKLLFDGQIDSRPLVSRCLSFELVADTLQVAGHVRKIALAENLTNQDIHAFVELVRRSKGSVRAALQAVDGGEML